MSVLFQCIIDKFIFSNSHIYMFPWVYINLIQWSTVYSFTLLQCNLVFLYLSITASFRLSFLCENLHFIQLISYRSLKNIVLLCRKIWLSFFTLTFWHFPWWFLLCIRITFLEMFFFFFTPFTCFNLWLFYWCQVSFSLFLSAINRFRNVNYKLIPYLFSELNVYISFFLNWKVCE